MLLSNRTLNGMNDVRCAIFLSVSSHFSLSLLLAIAIQIVIQFEIQFESFVSAIFFLFFFVSSVSRIETFLQVDRQQNAHSTIKSKRFLWAQNFVVVVCWFRCLAKKKKLLPFSLLFVCCCHIYMQGHYMMTCWWRWRSNHTESTKARDSYSTVWLWMRMIVDILMTIRSNCSFQSGDSTEDVIWALTQNRFTFSFVESFHSSVAPSTTMLSYGMISSPLPVKGTVEGWPLCGPVDKERKQILSLSLFFGFGRDDP